MKRFFQRLDNSSSYQRDHLRQQLDQSTNSSSTSGSFLGKVYNIGQYQCVVEDVIAEGGFSLVFLVKANNGIRYALKRLYVNNEQDLANCKREIEIATKLGSHKNIVKLIESTINYCGHDVFEIFILMQFCKGQLLHLMNERIINGFTENEILKILCDLCEAIGRMHSNNPPIIHRDLKIENILISDDGNYMLCDFGSATTRPITLSDGRQSALQIDEEIKRYTTLAYRSPEMVDVYSGKSITTKADIWALGCIVYKLCYFNLPFGESTLAIQNAQLTIPDSLSDRFSHRLSALIGYMLTPNPDERPDIYQVSTLAFELAGLDECPVVNKNKSKAPCWSSLKIPPTETQNREVRRSQPTSSSNERNNQSFNLSSANMNHSQSILNNLSSDADQKTTSVAPRQRPKASININSVLPTSPVAFQRSRTPNSNNGSNLYVKENSDSGNLGLLTNSQSFTSSNQLFSKISSDALSSHKSSDWISVGRKSPSFASNPVLNKVSNDLETKSQQSKATISGKNPFVTSLNIDGESYTSVNILSRNQSLTLLENSADADCELMPKNHPTSIIHHRRNMSDGSALSIRCSEQNFNIVPEDSKFSLNPFETSQDTSYEDQLFGKEFDRIRSIAIKDDEELNPFDAAPVDQQRLKRFLEHQNIQKNTHSSTNFPTKTSIMIRNDECNLFFNDSTNHQPTNTTSSTSKTIISIKSNPELLLSNNHAFQDRKTLKVSDNVDASSKVVSSKSISSSSQGYLAASPTTNYMPLYSSDTAEDEDFDCVEENENVNHHQEFDRLISLGKCINDYEDENDDEDVLLINSPNSSVLNEQFESPDEIFSGIADDKKNIVEKRMSKDQADSCSSIGSASDLQNSGTDTDDEEDSQIENNSSADYSVDDDSDADNEIGPTDDQLDLNVTDSTLTYGLVANRSDNSSIGDKKLLSIARVRVNNKNRNNNDDETSLSTSSLRSDSQKNIDSLDHLIGHVEGHRPLLEDEEEDDIINLTSSQCSNPIIDTSEPNLFISLDQKESRLKASKTENLTLKDDQSSIDRKNLHSDHETNLYSLHNTDNCLDDENTSTSLNDDNDENRCLDLEVERSLIPQVLYDQLNNKDLFGSIPFTDKELITRSLEQQKKQDNLQINKIDSKEFITNIPVSASPPSSLNLNLQKFDNSFIDFSPTKIEKNFSAKFSASNDFKSTDLFGAVPFEATAVSEITKSDKANKVVSNPIPLRLPPSNTQNSAQNLDVEFQNKNMVEATSTVITINTALTIKSSITNSSLMKNLSSKMTPKITSTLASTTATKTQPSSFGVDSQHGSISIGGGSMVSSLSSKLGRNQLQRSNLKIKSKVAKKYEVDESDDEVDGLLDPMDNDDIENDQDHQALDSKNKKIKKDKKDKSKIKDEKKSKSKSAEKAKTKEILKEEKRKEKEKEKERKKDKKDKESKEKKEKKESKKSSSEITGCIEKKKNNPLINRTTVASSSSSSLSNATNMILTKATTVSADTVASSRIIDCTTTTTTSSLSLASKTLKNNIGKNDDDAKYDDGGKVLPLKDEKLKRTQKQTAICDGNSKQQQYGVNNDDKKKTKQNEIVSIVIPKSSSSSLSTNKQHTNQAFSNMSFEDEILHLHSRQHSDSASTSTSSSLNANKNSTITKC